MRMVKQEGGSVYDDGTLFLDFSMMKALLFGKEITLTAMEYRILKELVRHPQRVFTRQVLLETLWDIDGKFVDEHALTSAISRIRSKIETDEVQYLKTVYGIGYMWMGGIKK